MGSWEEQMFGVVIALSPWKHKTALLAVVCLKLKGFAEWLCQEDCQLAAHQQLQTAADRCQVSWQPSIMAANSRRNENIQHIYTPRRRRPGRPGDPWTARQSSPGPRRRPHRRGGDGRRQRGGGGRPGSAWPGWQLPPPAPGDQSGGLGTQWHAWQSDEMNDWPHGSRAD